MKRIHFSPSTIVSQKRKKLDNEKTTQEMSGTRETATSTATQSIFGNATPIREMSADREVPSESHQSTTLTGGLSGTGYLLPVCYPHEYGEPSSDSQQPTTSTAGGSFSLCEIPRLEMGADPKPLYYDCVSGKSAPSTGPEAASHVYHYAFLERRHFLALDVSYPYDGATFMIVNSLDENGLTVERGHVYVGSVSTEDRACHWRCSIKEGWYYFSNAVTGQFLTCRGDLMPKDSEEDDLEEARFHIYSKAKGIGHPKEGFELVAEMGGIFERGGLSTVVFRNSPEVVSGDYVGAKWKLFSVRERDGGWI